MREAMHLYATTNQDFTAKALETKQNPYELLKNWCLRLRKAMGDQDILSPNQSGGEFRVPNFWSYAGSLERNPWMALNSRGNKLFVIPYSNLYEGREAQQKGREYRKGFMVSCVSPYEYAYSLRDINMLTGGPDAMFAPDLLDNGTFGVWLELLPQPVSVNASRDGVVTIRWNDQEPRVHRSTEMGRYRLPYQGCSVTAALPNWRLSRAEAYVRAWEKMTANEPADKYASVMLKEYEEMERKWNR